MLKLKVIHHHHHRHYYQAQGFVIQIDKQMLLFGCYDDIPDTLIDRQLLFSNKQKNSAIINRFFFGRLIKIKKSTSFHLVFGIFFDQYEMGITSVI